MDQILFFFQDKVSSEEDRAEAEKSSKTRKTNKKTAK